MTVILDDIPNMSKEDALVVLNNMMQNFASVRLQVNSSGSGATQFMLQDVEVVDRVIELLFERINNPNKDVILQVETLQDEASNVEIKAYHALSYDDGAVETQLRSSIKDISNVNKKFVEFIKSKMKGDGPEFERVKKDFLLYNTNLKDKYDVTIERHASYLPLEEKIESGHSRLDEVEDKIAKEESFRKGPKHNMLGQVLTTIAIASSFAKIVKVVLNKRRDK